MANCKQEWPKVITCAEGPGKVSQTPQIPNHLAPVARFTPQSVESEWFSKENDPSLLAAVFPSLRNPEKYLITRPPSGLRWLQNQKKNLSFLRGEQPLMGTGYPLASQTIIWLFLQYTSLALLAISGGHIRGCMCCGLSDLYQRRQKAMPKDERRFIVQLNGVSRNL